MASPQGQLLHTITRTNRGARVRLAIWLVFTVALFAFGLLAGPDRFAFWLLAIIPGLLALVTAPYALRKQLTVEIYEDGLKVRRVGAAAEREVTWPELKNVMWTLKPEAGEIISMGVGSALGGVVGALAEAGLATAFKAQANSVKMTALTLDFADPPKLYVDGTFKGFQDARDVIMSHAVQVWRERALAQVSAGQPLILGKFRLLPDGVTHGKRHAPWSSVLGAGLTDPKLGYAAVNWQEPGKRNPSSMTDQLWLQSDVLEAVVAEYHKRQEA